MNEGAKEACRACNGTGKELCNNPDHGFIDNNLWGKDSARLGCPCCGHDNLYRTKYDCPDCNGTGLS